MSDLFQNLPKSSSFKEKKLKLESKERKNIKTNNIQPMHIFRKKEKIESRKIEDSIDISVDSMELDEEEGQLKENKKIINKAKNKNLNSKSKSKIKNKKKLINKHFQTKIKKKKKKESEKDKKFLNKKKSFSKSKENQENHEVTEEENLINQLLKLYSFDIIFKKCLQEDLDVEKNLDNFIINLVNNLGYEKLFKILLSKFGLFSSSKINNNGNNIQQNDTEYMKDFPINNSIIKIMDIKVNKFRPHHSNISKNNKGLGLHLQKNQKGEIYKYILRRVNNYNAWFNCSNKNCRGLARLELKNKEFKVKRDHTIKYKLHTVYNKIIPNEIPLFDYFKKIDKNDVQIIYRYAGDAYAIFY